MKFKKSAVLLAAVAALGTGSVWAAAVPVDSPYYEYLKSLHDAGYITAVPEEGATYSRMELAQLAVEAEGKAQSKPMPVGLADRLYAIESYVAPEIDEIRGTTTTQQAAPVTETEPMLRNSADTYRPAVPIEVPENTRQSVKSDNPAAMRTSANVPVDSVYYAYLEKLSGMGYIESLPTGAKPYSRMQFAEWTIEAEKLAADREMPPYLADQLHAIEAYVAPEVAVLRGETVQDTLKLREVTAALAVNSGTTGAYRYNGSHAHWQPFGMNNNGYRYGDGANGIVSASIAGNIGHETAIAVRPRFSYDKDQQFKASLEEGYIKTRTGVMVWELGKESMVWGQGATGSLLLGNNMKPLTTVQAHLVKPHKIGGFFRFLGEADFHLFYGQLEGDRSDSAKALGRKDYDHVGLFGLRADFTPTDYFTFGLSRVSMLGGDGKGLSRSDWGHWLTGTNADSTESDRWNDIAGFDFRLRFPGVQWYGEVYGEDQGGFMPTKRAYHLGVYIPRLTHDGSWDMTIEGAQTTPVWYTHWTYQNGWTYSDNIIGDAMGGNSRKYYIGVKHYLPKEAYIGFYVMHMDMDRTATYHPVVNEAAFMGQKKISDDVVLNGTLGYAQVKHGNYDDDTDNNLFAIGSLQWRY